MSFYLYLNKNTFIHKLDPRTKFLALLASFIFSVINNNIYILLYILLAVLICAALSKAFSNIKKILMVLGFVGVFSVLIWTLSGGCSKESILYGIRVSLKIIVMLLSGLVFLSTTKNEEICLGLSKIGLPYAASFAISLALRLVPTFMNNVKNIYDAQRCRGLDINGGSLIQRLKKYIPLLGPIFLVTLRSTDQLSMALEAKGFGAKNRTNYIEISFKKMDFVIIAIIFFLIIFDLYCESVGKAFIF